jgi:hypothetical protein
MRKVVISVLFIIAGFYLFPRALISELCPIAAKEWVRLLIILFSRILPISLEA